MSLQSVEFTPDQVVRHELPPHGISARFFCSVYPAFDINVTENLQQFTYGVCDLSRIVDDVIDKPEVTTPATFDALMDGVEKKELGDIHEADAVVALRYVESLADDQLEFARRLYLDAVGVAEQRRSARSVHEYGEAIVAEAVVQCGALAVSEEIDLPDAAGRKAYNAWLRKFILAGYYVDSAIDLTQDHQEGRTKIPPTLRTRAMLLKKAVPSAKEAIATTPPRLLPLIGSMAIGFFIPSVNKRFSQAAIHYINT